MIERLETYEKSKGADVQQPEVLQPPLVNQHTEAIPSEPTQSPTMQQPELPSQSRIIQQTESVRSQHIQSNTDDPLIRSEAVRPEPSRPQITRPPTVHPEAIQCEAAQQHDTIRQHEIRQEPAKTPLQVASGRHEAVRRLSYPDYYRPTRDELPRTQYTPKRAVSDNDSDVYHLTDAELEQQCRESFTSFNDDAFGEKRRAVIKAEFGARSE
jgi:hypothetical protein